MFTIFRRFCKICPEALLILDMAKKKRQPEKLPFV
nr:MAG TPA: hypothetical protein [Caudoviricetes sp.]